MNSKCLYCYQVIKSNGDFHEKCSLEFFGTKNPPNLSYTLDQMTELAKNVVERSIAVPGVQPKLSLTVVREALNNGDSGRLTVVGALGGNYILKPPSLHYAEMPQNEHVTMRMRPRRFRCGCPVWNFDWHCITMRANNSALTNLNLGTI